MFNKKNHQLSIVIPILNEAKNINILIPKIVNCIKNKIKKYRIILEPFKKNTAPAILSSALIKEIPYNQPMIFFTSDNLIG